MVIPMPSREDQEQSNGEKTYQDLRSSYDEMNFDDLKTLYNGKIGEMSELGILEGFEGMKDPITEEDKPKLLETLIQMNDLLIQAK
ncbi:hypothetical protein GOV14_03720 [Candidatus Pacearchaeota archaeon]|nr:hypothetical protein [Candidatus Pacearchaeota archaeon]